jgi:peroxiredoxin
MRVAAALLVVVSIILVSCSGDRGVDRGEEGPAERYAQLRRQAMEEIGAWGIPDADAPDPRPAWADRLVAFAAENRESPEAGEALHGAMTLRAARQNAAGFFEAYNMMLAIAPDSSRLQEVFEDVAAMHMVEEAGYGIMETQDLEVRKRAHLQALEDIVADLKRAIEATSRRETKAAAHLAIGLNLYESSADPEGALEQLYIVGSEYGESHLAGSARAIAGEIEKLAKGMPAPDFEASTLTGETVSLASYEGKILLLVFWRSGCEPCVQQRPELERAARRYRRLGFTILGINLDADIEEATRQTGAAGIRWPVVASGSGMADPIARAYGVRNVPMSFLIGRDGTIQARALWGREVAREVSRLIEH